MPASWKELLIGALFGGVAGVLLAQYFEAQRDLRHLQVQTFLMLEQEFLFQDPELVRIRRKFENSKKPLTDEEKDYYLGYFEDVGAFAQHDLVDMYLLDQLLGQYLLEAYDDKGLLKYVHQSRIDDNDADEYENFEKVAIKLKAMDASDLAKKAEQK